MNSPRLYYLEDIEPGMRFSAPSWQLTEAEIVAFASRFDPQGFHTDPEAARASPFGRLIASGWHSAAVMSSLAQRSELQMVGGQIGIEVERLRFRAPVYPGDTLTLGIEILETRPSVSRPGFGILKVLWTLANQNGETVQDARVVILVRARSGQGDVR